MGVRDDRKREERALDALIVMALRLHEPGDLEPLPDPNGPEPILNPEDRRALRALRPHLMQRLRRETQDHQPARRRQAPRPRRGRKRAGRPQPSPNRRGPQG
ncbi:MAG TPA: hypothetical protein VG013_00525 [Gemmataceae bacterium]|nr:hypothetical protein [Gemmataceae bacterium]